MAKITCFGSLCCLIVACMVVITQAADDTDAFRNYVRRNVPNGFTMSAFVETCEGCGVIYGKGFTYKCLADRSLEIFKGCYTAVYSKKFDYNR